MTPTENQTPPAQPIDLTARELAVINIAIQAEPSGQPKLWAVGQLGTAMSIHEKIVKNVDKDNKFIDGKVELTTEEKSLILNSIKRPWTVNEGKEVGEIEKKLA